MIALKERFINGIEASQVRRCVSLGANVRRAEEVGRIDDEVPNSAEYSPRRDEALGVSIRSLKESCHLFLDDGGYV
jgi:hypothetical protein